VQEIEVMFTSRYKCPVAHGEILVVGGERIVERWPVVSVVEPDVVVVRAPMEDLSEIARSARLVMVRRIDGGIVVTGDESALDELSEGARIFVSAWRERRTDKPGRVGEGQPWDAAGFEPPDRPNS
jgi:hypothetical protein